MEAVVGREYMTRALRRVEANQGAPGVDGMTVEELLPYLRKRWAQIKGELLEGTYRPAPVRTVEIPKPGGKGTRMLGIPTVLDRLIQQALQQVLSPIFEPDFSQSSYGFRPGRSADAFCRYADDCNVYVRSQRAGERVMASLTRFLEGKLKLRVNREKSAVDRPWRRKFLGYSMTWHKTPRLRVAAASMTRLKAKLREVFRSGRGPSLRHTIHTLTPILRGWSNYFQLAEVKGTFEELDGWIRRKLRCLLWRQWKRSRTRARNLMQRGLAEERARRSANNGRGPWWNAGASHMSDAFGKACFDERGLVSLLDQQRRFQRAS
nr:group II intron maturase-specific domain-containing protein [Limnochorda pilosa]